MSDESCEQIQRVGVVGGGLMGSGIAEVCARRGLDVIVSEVKAEFAEAAARRIEKSLARAVAAGKATAAEADAADGRITVVVRLDALADRQLVIEAATENEQLKLAVFSELDGIVVGGQAILASNTSSIPITKLSVARPAIIGAYRTAPRIPSCPKLPACRRNLALPYAQVLARKPRH